MIHVGLERSSCFAKKRQITNTPTCCTKKNVRSEVQVYSLKGFSIISCD